TRYWLLVTGYWSFVIRYSWIVDRYSLMVGHTMPDARRQMRKISRIGYRESHRGWKALAQTGLALQQHCRFAVAPGEAAPTNWPK
ncbi:MAG: hypothetical protein KAT27_04425, partial [Desulfobacterales bacterium]|nr:hypothetical protein [Desulfobacterales bacterium]